MIGVIVLMVLIAGITIALIMNNDNHNTPAI